MLRLLIIIALLGAAIYFVFWTINRRAQMPPSQTSRGPMGPDDDEDFLRDLEWRQRQRRDHRDPPPDQPFA